MRAMKDSGVEWIGKIPQDWKVTKISTVYQERNVKVSDKDFSPLSVTKNGIVPQLETAAKTDNNDNRKLIKKNDFVINSRSDRRGSCGISNYDGSCSLINIVLEPRKDMCNKYYNFVFKSDLFSEEFYRWGNGIVDDLWSTKWSSMKNIYIPFPVIEEQQRIAAYLDSKCSKIDAIIAKQQAVIEKLREYKLSVLNEIIANTRGIRCYLNNIGTLKNGLNFMSDGDTTAIKFLGVGDFKDYYILDRKEMFSDITINEIVTDDYLLRDGDMIFVRSNGSKDIVGKCVMVKNIDYPLTYSGFCIRFRNSREDIALNDYLLLIFRSPFFREQMERYSRGSNINNLNQAILSEVPICLPSIIEQKNIVSNLDVKFKIIDDVIQRRQSIIDKLTEYKKSLIYEVVTGKKEV